MPSVNFSTNGVPEQEAFALLPAGWYLVEAEKSEWRQAKSGGRYLEVQYTVLGPTHKGRKLWDRFNLVSSSEQAVEIARKSLAALCRAAGRSAGVRESEELHKRPVEAKITIRRSEEYGDHNEIKAYRPHEGASFDVSPQVGEQAASSSRNIADDDIPF